MTARNITYRIGGNPTSYARLVVTPPEASLKFCRAIRAEIRATSDISDPKNTFARVHVTCPDSLTAEMPLPAPIIPDWTVGAGGDFATLPLAIASPLVVSGQALCLLDGTYNLAAQLVVDKSLTIFGQSRTGAILRCLAATEIANLISVTAADVIFRNMTIGHYKTTNVATDSAIDLPGAGVAGFIMDNCTCIYEETAVIVQSSGWEINNCTFTYAGPINGATFSTIITTLTSGNAFITNNVFDNSALVTGTATAILASTGNIEGVISIEDNTHLGLLAQLMSIDTFSGADNNLSICAKRNIVTETDAFIIFTCADANFGDKLTLVSAEDNVLTNAHEKGIFAVDNGGVAIAFRSVGNLPLHVDGNTLGIETIAAGWAAATGSTHATCNYNTVTIVPAVVVTQDAIIPVTPTPPLPVPPLLPQYLGDPPAPVPYPDQPLLVYNSATSFGPNMRANLNLICSTSPDSITSPMGPTSYTYFPYVITIVAPVAITAAITVQYI